MDKEKLLENTDNISREALKELIEKLKSCFIKLNDIDNKDIENTNNIKINNRLKKEILNECKESISKTKHWNNILNCLIKLQKNSEQSGNKGIILLSNAVIESVCAQNDIMENSKYYVKPRGKELDLIIGTFTKYNNKIQEIGYIYKDIDSIIKITLDSLEIYNWIFNEFNCDEIVNNYYNQIEMFVNKIIKNSNEHEKEWVNCFKDLMKEIALSVSSNFSRGLDWDRNGDNDIFNLILKVGTTYRKYFKKNSIINEFVTYEEKEINKNINKIHEEITKGNIKSQLKPINKDILNNESEYRKKENDLGDNRNINSYFSYSSSESGITDASDKKICLKKRILNIGKRDNYTEKGNIILYENFNGLIKCIKNENLNTETFLRITNCQNCAFKIEKKINRIFVINSENIKIICGGLVSHIELINCSKVKIQSDGCINMATIEGCDEITLYLDEKNGHIPINYTQSNGINLKLLKEGKYVSYCIPQQFIYRVKDDMKSEVDISQIYM